MSASLGRDLRNGHDVRALATLGEVLVTPVYEAKATPELGYPHI